MEETLEINQKDLNEDFIIKAVNEKKVGHIESKPNNVLQGHPREYFDVDRHVFDIPLYKGESINTRKIHLFERLLDLLPDDRIIVTADAHFGKNGNTHDDELLEDLIKQINKKADQKCAIVVCGDFCDGDCSKDFMVKTTRKFLDSLICKNVALLLGNNEYFNIKDYEALGFKAVGLKLDTKKYLYSHNCQPVYDKPNIFGHLHGNMDLFGCEPKKKIDIGFQPNEGKPLKHYGVYTVKEALEYMPEYSSKAWKSESTGAKSYIVHEAEGNTECGYPLIESAEMFFARHADYKNKELHLYRAMTSKKEVIEPTFINLGTRLSKPRLSSFWFDDESAVIEYGLFESGLKSVLKNQYDTIPTIDELEKLQKYPNIVAWAKRANVTKMPMIGTKNKDMKVTIYSRDEEMSKTIKEAIMDLDLDFYVYSITIPGNTKDLGIGHNKNRREFTIDHDIKPDKVEHYTKIDESLFNRFFEFTYDLDDFLQKSENNIANLVPNSPFETWLKDYFNINTTVDSPQKIDRHLKRFLAGKKTTELFKNEFISEINRGEDAIVLADIHLGKHEKTQEEINNRIADLVKEIDDKSKALPTKPGKNLNVLILGDFIDKKCKTPGYIIERFTNIIKKKLKNFNFKYIYVLGNSENDYGPDDLMYYDRIGYAAYKIETDKYVFTHMPIDMSKSNKINIHGHLHGINKYWDMDPDKHIDVWHAGAQQALLLSEILKLDSRNPYAIRVNTDFEKDKPIQKLMAKYSLQESIDNISKDSQKVLKLLQKVFINKDWEYGFNLKSEQVRFKDMKKEDYWKRAETEYEIQPVSLTLKTKLGTCFDVVNVERQILNKLKIAYKSVWIYRNNDPSQGHNIILIILNGKYYYLELTPGTHPDYYGKVREYESYVDFLDEKKREGFKVADITEIKTIGEKPENIFKKIGTGNLLESSTFDGTELYMVRHGEVAWNALSKEKKMELYSNAKLKNDSVRDEFESLTDLGKKQVKEAANALSDVDFDIAFVSPYMRTKETANIILKKHPKTKIIYDDRIKEIDYRKSLTKKEFDYMESHKVNGVWQPLSTLPDKGKRLFKSILSPIASFIDDIKKEHKGERILMVSHGGVIKMARLYLERSKNAKTDIVNDPNVKEKFKVTNAEIVHELIESSNDEYSDYTIQDALFLTESVYSLKTSEFNYAFDKVETCIKKASNIYIVAHVKPDDDSLGSMRGLGLSIKEKYPKKNVIMLNGNSKGIFELDKNDLLIFVDLGSWYRADMPENLKNMFIEKSKDVKICRFDHHENEEIDEVYSDIEDRNAGSACSLVTLFLQSQNYNITPKVASMLFKGIISDTGRMQYSLSKATLLALSILTESGVDYEKIYSNMYLQSPKAMRAKRYILGNYLTTKSGVAYIYLNNKIAAANGFDRGEAAAMVHELSTISGSLIWMSCNDVNGEIRCRVRSRYITIDKLANKWGGGGHANAVGIKVKNKNELSRLIDDLDDLVREAKMKNPLLENMISLDDEMLLLEAEDQVQEEQQQQEEVQPTPIEFAAMINQDYVDQMKQLNKMYQKQISDVLMQAQQQDIGKDQEYQAVIQQYEEQMAQMQANFEQQFNDTCAQYEQQIAELQQAAQEQMAQMQADAEAQLNDAGAQIQELSGVAQDLDSQNQELAGQVEQLQMDQNIQRYPYLQPMEGEEPFIQKYRAYVETHIANVQQSFDWIQQNCPELLQGCNLEYLANEIANHDLSKYSEEEFYPYARHFYQDKTNQTYSHEFDIAWNHHQKTNKHHWEYWLLRQDDRLIPLDMPLDEIVHEICDWMSFGFKNGNLLNIGSYYQMNKNKMLMSPATRKQLEELLQILIYRINELEGAPIEGEDQ